MSSQAWLCPNPDCAASVIPTARRNIAGHYKADGRPCPASYGTPFSAAIPNPDFVAGHNFYTQP